MAPRHSPNLPSISPEAGSPRATRSRMGRRRAKAGVRPWDAAGGSAGAGALTCGTAPSALVAWPPPGNQSSRWNKLSLGTSGLQWIFLEDLGAILTGVNPFLHGDLPKTPSPRLGEVPISAQNTTLWTVLVEIDNACAKKGLTVSVTSVPEATKLAFSISAGLDGVCTSN